MSVVCMLAWCGAAISLWSRSRRGNNSRYSGSGAYLWLAAAAGLWCAGLIASQLDGGTAGLSFADLPPLLAVASAAVGIMLLIGPRRDSDGADVPSASVLPGLADGYVMAVALLVIGWVALFGGEFHRSGARPGTFLLDLIHPLADLAVLGALLPLVTAAWRRATLPYLALLAVAVSDSLAVGQRVSGSHPALAAQLIAILAALLFGLAPWNETTPRLPVTARVQLPGMANAGAATVVAALSVCVATVAVVANGLAGAPSSGLALVVAGGAGVLVLAARIFMLVRENGLMLSIWRESSRNLRDLANRTSDVVLVCDVNGTVRYASTAVAGYGYAPGELEGRRLTDFVHPEDQRTAANAVRQALGVHEEGLSPRAARGGGAPPEERAPHGRFPCRVRAADGTWRHIEATALRFDVPGEPSGQLLVTARDVSDQVALRQQVTHLTFHDGLTGLPNRAYMEERARDGLRSVAARANGQGGPDGQRTAGVIFLDLDRFTAVNDSVGHGAGDLVLAQAARRLRAVVPGHDTVARWGSDEFAVLVEARPAEPGANRAGTGGNRAAPGGNRAGEL